jgi:hypothetical protein
MDGHRLVQDLLGVALVAGSLRCLWRALRALLTGVAVSSGNGIVVHYERDKTPWRFAAAVADDAWLGAVALLVVCAVARGIPEPYDRFAFACVAVPLGLRFLWAAVRGWATDRIESFGQARTRRYAFSQSPLYFMYYFFTEVGFGVLTLAAAWWYVLRPR